VSWTHSSDEFEYQRVIAKGGAVDGIIPPELLGESPPLPMNLSMSSIQNDIIPKQTKKEINHDVDIRIDIVHGIFCQRHSK
jgi:hypothetical protein